ncbi:MAG TPA: proton-conducting transporter membrane subunit, partial [Bacteroidales bacterium]|nr:proton-conducting transporter membrane subunit [Bacteroidales bacterium]
IAIIGTITAFVSATIAITQVDFKKVLAYSTVSQLGFMIMSLGTGGYTNGFFHLVTHAWFKAALFLAAGSVIHAMHHAMHHMHDHHSDPQDINNMGGLRKTMPWTYRTFLFMTLALAGAAYLRFSEQGRHSGRHIGMGQAHRRLALDCAGVGIHSCRNDGILYVPSDDRSLSW